MDEIVTDPIDTKSLPLQVSESLNDLQALLSSDPFVQAVPSIMLQPDPCVERLHALTAFLKEINRTLPPQVVPRNWTTAGSPPGVLQALAGNGVITSPRPQSLQETAGSLQPDIIQVTAGQKVAAPPPTHSPPADHPGFPTADDSWCVRIQEQIAARPEDQREEFYNAIMQAAADNKAAQPEGRQGERSPLSHISQGNPPWLPKADDSWFVRHQKELIAAEPEDQREKVYNAYIKQGQSGRMK